MAAPVIQGTEAGNTSELVVTLQTKEAAGAGSAE
jgi:hypothetical protein